MTGHKHGQGRSHERPAPSQRSRQRPSERARLADDARLAAFDTLRAVAEQDAYANLFLPGLLRERRVGGRDAAFATELAYGTLRMQGLYDAVLARCVDRPLQDLDPGLLDALRLGVHQLLGMRVPAHAAVSETVALVRHRVGPGPGALANAVLRRVGGQDLSAWVEVVAPEVPAEGTTGERLRRAAVAYSHPEWVVRALREALLARGLGEELDALLDADNTAPGVSLVARPGLADVDELLAAGGTPGRWSPVAVAWPGGDPGGVRAVRERRAAVQDEGSQLVAIALSEVAVDGRDERWLDLCAGPGGKAALLAALAAGRGAQLTAVEVAEHRAELVRAALAPSAQSVDVRCADGRTVGQDEPGSYDRVIVDVPCTGLGALRRRPEARWRRTLADLTSLAPLQRDLLASALLAVRPGGVVAYTTCSPHLAETELVVRDVVKRREDVELLDARPYLPGVADLGDGPTVQLWPHRHGTDAMFLALLRRR